MKPFFLFIALFTCVFFVNAQPTTGLKIGANYTFYKDNEQIDFTPNMGYQLGYAWRIKLNETLALSLEGMFTKKSADVIWLDDAEEWNNGKQNAYYVSAPLGINYNWKNLYAGIGYEFGINTDTGTLPVNRYDHALFLQCAYKIKYFDVVLKYAASLNQEDFGGISYTSGGNSQYVVEPTKMPRANTVQLSLIFNFEKKDK